MKYAFYMGCEAYTIDKPEQCNNMAPLLQIEYLAQCGASLVVAYEEEHKNPDLGIDGEEAITVDEIDEYGTYLGRDIEWRNK